MEYLIAYGGLCLNHRPLSKARIISEKEGFLIFFQTPCRQKDLNPGVGLESRLSVFSSPLSDLAVAGSTTETKAGSLPMQRRNTS